MIGSWTGIKNVVHYICPTPFDFCLYWVSIVISSAEVNMIEKLLSVLRHLTTNDLVKHMQEYWNDYSSNLLPRGDVQISNGSWSSREEQALSVVEFSFWMTAQWCLLPLDNIQYLYKNKRKNNTTKLQRCTIECMSHIITLYPNKKIMAPDRRRLKAVVP